MPKRTKRYQSAADSYEHDDFFTLGAAIVFTNLWIDRINFMGLEFQQFQPVSPFIGRPAGMI